MTTGTGTGTGTERPTAVTLDAGGLASIVRTLVDSGRRVIGPVVRDGVITLGPVTDADEFPTGRHDEQGPGRYRTFDTGDGSYFGYATTAHGWKRYVHPEQTVVIRSHRGADGIVIDDAPVDTPPLAFVGIRSCDLAALDRLGTVLVADDGHRRRRVDLAVVAVACTASAATCFCASMGTGPAPGAGADVVLTELDAGTFVATAQTRTGEDLLAACPRAEPATPHQVAEAGALVASCEASQVRRLDADAVRRAAEAPEHRGWNAIADRCLTCGNCTMVCPTCFCTAIEDRTSVTDDGIERRQRWDSSFSLDFSHIHGGPVRASASSRYRQWYLHKLVTWHDQFGTSGCVGCGRCITWCPTGIDITEEVVP